MTNAPDEPKLPASTEAPVTYEGGMEPLDAQQRRRGVRRSFAWLALHSEAPVGTHAFERLGVAIDFEEPD